MSFLDIILLFIPRYVTDRVALNCSHDGTWRVFCLEKDVRDGDAPFIHAYGTIKTFTWLGWTKGGMVKLDKPEKL